MFIKNFTLILIYIIFAISNGVFAFDYASNKEIVFSKTDLNQLLEHAKKLEDGSKYLEAIDIYNKALQITLKQNLITDSSFIYKKIGLLYYRQKKYNEAFNYFKKSIEKNSLSKNAADSYFNISLIYQKKGQEDSLLINLNKSIEIYKTFDASIDKFKTYSKGGILYKNAGKYDSAISCLLIAYKGFDDLDNQKWKAYTCNVLASTQRLLGNLDIAEKYYREALRLNLNLKDTLQISFSYVKVANLLKEQKKYDAAIVNYKKGIAIQDKLDNKKDIGKMVNNLATVYYLMDNYKKAIETYQQALIYKKKENDTLALAYTYNELAILAIHNKSYKQAKKYLDSSSIFISDINNKDVILRKYEIETLYYKSIGKHKEALNSHQKYTKLYKTIFTENQSKIIQELQEKFESKQKQEKISELSISNENKIEIIDDQKKDLDQKNLLLITAIFMLLLGIGFYFYLKQKQKTKIKSLELKRLESIHKGQETIKESISNDLHDIITTSYDGIRLKILALSKAKDPATISSNIIKEIKEINQEIRLISHRLSPLGNKIKNNPLRELITSQLSEFQYYRKIFIDIKLPLPEELDSMKLSSQTNFYGIILEALHNIEKHSKATEVKISHKKNKNNYLNFIISDNGVGFKIENKRKGIGLLNMKQRAQLLYGECVLKSSDTGTIVYIKFPIKQNII